jgi:predicted RNase H-like HicB family nuclease
MKIRIITEYDEITNSYSAYCPELPGCTSCGDTEIEALESIKEAIELYFEPVEIPLEHKHVHELAI